MAITLKTVKQLDRLTTVPNTVDVIVNDANGVTKRAQLSDILSLDNIPSAALERLVKVANQTARYALTTSDVQLGDSVLQLDTGIMYIVVDTAKLNSADGYQEYKAGTAAKAYSDESGNNIKSNYASSLEISNGSVLLKNKNGTTLSTQSLPSTVGTFYGTETTASASAQAKTATVTNNDFALSAGVMVIIKFVNTNTFEATASNHITLNVNSTGAKSITIKGNELPLGDQPDIFGRANYYHTFVYDGTYWVWQSCSINGGYSSKIFTGTTDEWEALSDAQQDIYDIINITDDDANSERISQEIADIVNVYGAKNLIPYPYRSTSGNYYNIDVNILDDGSIKLNGTCNQNVGSGIGLVSDTDLLLKPGTYTLSGTGSSGGTGKYFLQILLYENRVAVTSARDLGDGVTFTVPSGHEYYCVINFSIANNFTFSNEIVKPMLRLASIQDDTYEPYVPTNKELLSCKLNGYVGAKNLLPYPYSNTTKTENGITFTDNGDGTITANGTATADVTFKLFQQTNTPFPNGTYIFTGCPSGGSYTKYHIDITDNAWSNAVRDYGDGAGLQATNDNVYQYARIAIQSGTTVSNLTFKPMIRRVEDTDPTWQPYAKTNKELTDDSANKKDLTDINITSGTTNNTGSTITSGTFFYYQNKLVKAKTDIANGATLTLNTNYEEVTAGGLNALNSALATREVTYSYTTDNNGSVLLYIDNNKTTRANPNYHIIDYVEMTDSNGNAVAGIPCPRNTDYLYRAISMVNGAVISSAIVNVVVGYHNKL